MTLLMSLFNINSKKKQIDMVGVIIIGALAVCLWMGELVKKGRTGFYKGVIEDHKKFYSDLREKDKLCPCGKDFGKLEKEGYCSNEECLEYN
jgi:hypothetical protein